MDFILAFYWYISILLVLYCDVNALGTCRLEGFCLAPAMAKNYNNASICTPQCSANEVCCNDSGIARKKCIEYGQFVNKSGFAEALTGRSKMTQKSDCSIAVVSLVVGGTDAKPKEFPHMVAIGYGDSAGSVVWLCGGSLISEQHVLTAAHCNTSPDLGEAKFGRLGSIDLLDYDTTIVQSLLIVQRIVHPKYKPPSKYHDIAIFKLEKPVEIDEYTRPACLHDSESFFMKNSGNNKAFATGWGKTEYRRKTGSNILQKVELDIIDEVTCNKSFKGDQALEFGVQPSMICAGVLQGGKDTCQGDSGGPLQIVLDHPYCMYAIIGITSFGKACGFKNSPAIYTRVSYYIPWIESVVWQRLQ